MATEAKNTNYWISSTALSIQLNSMGEPDYIQCSVVSGASVLCYMSDVPGLGYDAGHNYQRWTLAAYPSIFPDSKRKYVYIAIPRQSTTDNNQATVVFPGEKIDIYGKTIPSSGTEGVQIGNEAYYYIFTGGIISAVKTDADNTRKREWEQHFDCGKLATDEAIASGGEGAWWRYNSVSDTITFLKEILKANFNELSAKVARVTSLFLGGHELKGVADSNGTLETSNDTVVTPQYLGQFGVKHFLAKDKDDTAYGTITWEKVQKFFSGLLVGNSNNENGGSWTTDAEGRSHLITDYLEVRMKAIFEELVINKTSTIGGKEIISPAGGVVAHKVEEVTVTYNNVSQKAYRCYFLAEQEGDAVDNDFAVGDQVRSESFNVRKGTYHKAGNHFYWRLVIGRDEDPVELEGKKYHYIDLSDTDCATASDVPAKGDVLNQCGNRTDVERQNCLIFSAVDTYSPSISLYHGINSYSFANREYVEYGVNKQTNKAFFNVYGDMYVGDRPTKENGYEGSSYIRYDSSTKQMSVKAKISAKSTVDGKELSQYIKENTDDTVANAAIKAAEDAQKAAQNAQKDITILGNTVTGNKKEFDNYVTNGYLEPSEIAAMAQDSKRLEDDFAAAQKSYNEVKNAEVLKDTKELTDLNTAFATLTSAKTELVTYLSEISTNYNKADTNGKAAIVSAVGTKFTNFQSAYSAFYDKLGLANAYITRKIYGDLGVVIGDVTSLAYLKKALMDATDTEINGGLVLTSLIGLRDTGGNTTAGINGITEKSAKGGGIAAWFGGEMVDKDYNDGSKTPANTIFRFDGSGYVAGGAIWWGTDGRVHADPTSFIISEKNLGVYLTFFEPTWKEGSAGTSVADLVSLKPNAPFSKLGVSGDATFEGTISFHGIKLTYDSTNKAIKIDGNLYATGGITAYGAGASTTGGGGGLNGSVKSYSNALKLTSESLSEIASAYSIKALDSRISSLEGGSAMNVSVSGSGNAVTAISKSGTTISVTKGTTFLTSHQSLASYLTRTDAASLYQPKGNYLTAHQSLDGYVNAITTSGSGNAITSVTKSGKTVTFTKGATFLTSHQSLSAYLKSADAANTYLKLSGGAMTGNIRYKGSKSTYDMIKFVDNNADTYGNGICIGGGGLTIIGGGESADIVLSQHTSGGDENMIVANDAAIDFFSNVQNGWNSRKAGSFDTSGYWNGAGFKKDNSSDSYVLLGGGGHKAISSLSVNYASSAGSANSVAWSNVSGRPTKVSQFTNDTGYITSSGSCAYATSAGNADKLDGIHANGLLTALSNSDNGISLTVGGTIKHLNNIQVYSATKLVTSRNISIGGKDFVGNANFDGSGNIILNGAINHCTINIGSTDPNPYKRVAHIKVSKSWNDNALLLYINQGYNGGRFGLCRVDFRTNDIQNNDNAGGGVSIRWLIRSGYSTDSVQAGYYIHLKNAYVDVFVKTTGAYQGTVIRVIQDSRGSVNNYFSLINSSTDSEAYTSLSAAAIKLYNIAYQGTVSGYDDGVVKYSNSTSNADMVDYCHVAKWNGLPIVDNAGVMEIGKYIDFHNTKEDSVDYSTRIVCTGVHKNIVYLPSVGGTLALTSDNVASATKLAAARTIWGQSFDGTGNVSGSLSGVGHIQFSADNSYSIGTTTSEAAHTYTRQVWARHLNASRVYAGDTNLYIGYNNTAQVRFFSGTKQSGDGSNERMTISTNGNVGIGTTSPAYKLHVAGDIYSSDRVIANNSVLSNKLYSSTTPDITTPNKCIEIAGNTITEYHLEANSSPYHSQITLEDTSLTLGAYSGIEISAFGAITLNSMGAFTITYRNAKFTVEQNGSEYAWKMNSIKASGNILATGGITAYSSSDIRLKQDLRKLDYLGIIKAMGGTFSFAWKKDNTRSIGWIAQHVLCNPHLKDIVETDEKGYYKINYWSPKLIATAFGAIEQVGDEVGRLKARVVFLESEVQRLSGDKEDCNKKRLDNKNINSLN